MNKELEAVERVWEDCSQLDLDYVSKHNLMDDLREIKQALTPPTADEVIKALSEHYKHYDIYVSTTNTIYIKEDGYSIYEIYCNDGLLEIDDSNLPPHLITMIGKFYESLEGEKWK